MKKRIMRAFAEEIYDNGMKFTVDDVSKRLGISKRTLYEHFSSKEEILQAIIDDTLTEADEKSRQIFEDTSLTVIEKIRAIIMISPTYTEFLDLRILEQMKRYYPKQWAKINSALNDDWEALRRLIEQGILKGDIVDVNLALVIRLIVDSTNIILDRRFFMQNNISLSEALSSIVDVLLNGLIPNDKRG